MAKSNYSKIIILVPIIILIVLVGALTIVQLKYPNRPATGNTVERNDLSELFTKAGTEGTMVMRTLGSNEVTVVNTSRSRQAYSPSSTFKIPHSLIALEEKAVQSPGEVFNGPRQPFLVDGKSFLPAPCEQDITFQDAYKNSCITVYQEIARLIPRNTYERYMREMAYGNQDIGGTAIDTFWLEGNLNITPLQQINFLEALYKEELGAFSQQTQNTVKTMMLSETTPEYKISAKTGWVFTTETNLGWWVGWVEKQEKVTFFALNLDLTKPELAPSRASIGKEILKQTGAL